MLPKSSAVQIKSPNMYPTFLLDVKFPVHAIPTLSLSAIDNYKY